MAINKEQKKLYGIKIAPYREFTESVDKQLKDLEILARKNPNLKAYFEVKKTVLILQNINTLIKIAKISLVVQNFRNDTVLNDARKQLSNVLTSMLKIVGEDIDGSLTENKEKVGKLSEIRPIQKLRVLEALKKAAIEIDHELGSNNKYRWYFPDMHYKISVLARNMFDFKKYDSTKDPTDPDYRDMQEYLKFIIDESQHAAQGFRSKFEISTQDEGDLYMIRKLLESIKQIYLLTGNKNDLVKIKTAIDANEEKIETVTAAKKGKKS